MNPVTLDQDAVNLAKAIRQTESGGNFTARGKSGEYGAYQYTPEQQNEVAYKKIKELKDAGHNVGEIASIWNSGKPDAYLDTSYTGTNKHGAKFDVPAYAKSVATAYHTIKAGGTPSIDKNNPSSTLNPENQEPGFFKELGSDVSNRLGQLSKAVTDTTSGKINPLSGIIQSAGALGGGLGDIAGNVITHTPVVGDIVKGFGGLIGKGVGKLAQTEAGQKTIGAAQEFAQKHPELAADIGAGGDVLSGVAAFEGAGALKKGLISAAGKAAGKDALSGIVESLSPEIETMEEGQKGGVRRRGV